LLLAAWNILPFGKLRFVYTAPFVFSGILAADGIRKIITRVRTGIMRYAVGVLIFILFSVNSAISIKSYWFPELLPIPLYDNYFLTKSYLEVFDYLGSHVTGYAHIFSDFENGTIYPAFAPVISFVGHEVSTYDFVVKQWQADQFFKKPMNEDEASRLFRMHKIKYVVWNTCQYPDKSDAYPTLLTKVFGNDCFSIFTVN
jgi:hypothetical protein